MTKEKDDPKNKAQHATRAFGQISSQNSRYQFVDKNFRQISNLQVTSPTFEPGIERYVAYVDGQYKDAYFVNYDPEQRIMPDEIRRRIALGQMKYVIEEKGFTKDEKGNYYDKQGYLIVAQKDIIKIGEQFYYINPKDKKLNPKKVETDSTTGLITADGEIYEAKGDYIYDFWDRNKVYNQDGQPLHPLKNPFIHEHFPIKKWGSAKELTYISFPSDLSMEVTQSERAFYIQFTEENWPDNVKIRKHFLTSYDPVTHEPMDVVEIEFRRVEDGKNPATFRSEPLIFNALKDTTANRVVSDQIKAFPGSELQITYPTISGSMERVSMGKVSSRGVVEIDIVIYKDGNEKANLEAAKAQIAVLKEDSAAAGIEVRVVTKLIDKTGDLEFANPETLAIHARKQFSNPKGITMIMGAGNHEKYFTTKGNDFPKNAGNGFFVSDTNDKNAASALTFHILEIASGDKTPDASIEFDASKSPAQLQVIHHPLMENPQIAESIRTPASQPVLVP
ncbi:MAG: hypothetical protein K1X66_08260 [Verrucomicrobiae bacterium]|nr:hypothetical protein [Verrucomicrobiae bacterium]